MVAAPGPSALALPGGPLSTFSCWWWALPDLQLWHLPGAAVDGFTLVVCAPGPSALTPPRGPPLMFSRWWWALSDLQLRHLSGARHRRFHVGGGRSRTFSSGTSRRPAVNIFTLVVGAPGPSAPAPPGGHRRHFHIGAGRSWTFSSGTSRDPSSMFSRWWWALPDLQL
jgi:hypothetical protein